MTDKLVPTVFFLGLYFIVPIFIAKVPMGASWKAILIAYGIWIALLALFGLTSGRNLDEAIGWPLIMGMFFTIPAIIVIVLILKVAGVR